MNLIESNVKPKQIADEYSNGLSIGQIQRKYKCGTHKIYRALKLFGINVRPYEKIDLATIKHEYEELKMSTNQIAKKHNMNPVSVWERLKRGGVKTRDQKEEAGRTNRKISKSEYPKICQRYLDNPTDSSADIAKDYRVHKTTITKILKKHGLKLQSDGPKSGNWQGGITPLHTQIRHCEKAQEWIRKCMERDGFKCQITGQQGRLQVHHKRSFSQIFHEFLNQYPDKSRDELFDLSQIYNDFWDLENGLTLLASVHQDLHKKSYDPILAVEIQKFRQQGWNINKIAKYFKKDWHTINRIIILIS